MLGALALDIKDAEIVMRYHRVHPVGSFRTGRWGFDLAGFLSSILSRRSRLVRFEADSSYHAAIRAFNAALFQIDHDARYARTYLEAVDIVWSLEKELKNGT